MLVVSPDPLAIDISGMLPMATFPVVGLPVCQPAGCVNVDQDDKDEEQ